MKIFLTGKPGIGKTTIVKNFVRTFQNVVLGFWTEEIRDPHAKGRKEFSLFTTEGKSVVFSGIDIFSPFRVGKYGVDVKAFEETVLPLLRKCSEDEKRFIVVDEIGKMELFSKEFAEIIENIVFRRRNPFLGTIPISDIHPLVSKIRSSNEVKLLWVGKRTRDQIFGRVVKLFKDSHDLE